MQLLTQVIKRPIISEKSTALAEVASKYVFEVAPEACSAEIRQAVEKLFNVKVIRIHTQITHGKIKRSGRTLRKRPNQKKAIVTLAEGQRIDFFQTK